MGTIEASKYTSLSKLIDIRDNNYRGYHNKSGQVKDYDKESVDNLIAKKQSKLDDKSNEEAIDQWDQYEEETQELPEQDKKYFQARIKYLDKARAFYDSNGAMETARQYQKDIEEIEAKIYPKKPLDKALATIDKKKEEQKKVLRQTVKIIKELHINGTYSGSQTIDCLKRIAKDLENATGHRISFTKEVKRKPVETKAVTSKRHIDPKHSVRNWGYIYPNEYSSQNHVVQKYSLIDGEVVTIITLNGKPTTTTKYPKMTPKQLDELTKIYKEI